MGKKVNIEKEIKMELEKIDRCLHPHKYKFPWSINLLSIPVIKADKSPNDIIEAYCKEHELEFAYLDCRTISSSNEICVFLNEYGYTNWLTNDSKPKELLPKKHIGIMLIDHLSEVPDKNYGNLFRGFLKMEQEISDNKQRSTMLPIVTYDNDSAIQYFFSGMALCWIE